MKKRLVLISGVWLAFTGFAAAQEASWQDNLTTKFFVETRYGARIYNQDYEKNTSIAEARLHSEASYDASLFSTQFSADFIYDNVLDHISQDYESGEGYIDLREANISFSPADFMDVKMGRQIVTWGTGDLLFINDIFPKDWNAFFIGRDDAYLKAPSDALKTSLYSSYVNFDVVYMPNHESSRYIDGSRLSFYSPMLSDISGQDDAILKAKNEYDDEVAVRAYKNLGSAELAAYYFKGFYQTPQGMDAYGNFIFPKLEEYGASLRSPFLGGIASLEAGYYNSLQDSSGSNPAIINSQFKYLIGFEKEVWSEFTLGAQFYVEHMQDYDNYLANLPLGSVIEDENRQVIT